MKNLQSTVEGVWVEIKQVQLTEEQKKIISSVDKHPEEDVKKIMDVIKEQMSSPVHEDMSQLLTTFYNTKKPKLNETDSYELISIDVTDKDGDLFGILNCRVNGDHIQIRF